MTVSDFFAAQTGSLPAMIGFSLVLVLLLVIWWQYRTFQKHNRQQLSALEKQQQYIDVMHQISEVGHWVWDIADNSLWWSDEVYRILELQPQSIKPTFDLFMQMIHADDRKRVEEHIDNAINKGEQYAIEYRLIPGPGVEKYLQVKGRVILDARGKPTRMVGIAIDLTHQHQTMQLLEAARHRFQVLFENAQIGMMYTSAERVIVQANDCLLKIFGYESLDELIGLNLHELHLSDENDNNLGGLILDSLQNGYNHRIEYQVKRKNGATVWLEISGKVLQEQTASELHNGTLWIVNDISLQKEYLAELMASRKYAEELIKEQSTLLSLFEKGDLVLFKWINSENWPVAHVSQSVQKLLGYTPEDFISGAVLYSQCIVAQDLPRVGHEVSQAIELNLDFFGHEPYRIITSDKKTKWILDYTSTLKNDAGEITHFIGYLLDITDRKIQEELRTFRTTINDYSHIYDRHNLLKQALKDADRLFQNQTSFFYFIDEDGQISEQFWSENLLGLLNGMVETNKELQLMHHAQCKVIDNLIQHQNPLFNNHPDDACSSMMINEQVVAIERYIVSPVLRNNRMVGVMGGINKDTEYNDTDIEMMQQLADIIFATYEHKYAVEKIEHMAYFDTLTGLPNRVLLSDRMEQIMALCRRNGKIFAFCYLDLDGFKPVNDQYGHDIGDKLLKAFSSRVSQELRSIDSMARLGGDEFAIILSNLSSIQEGIDIIERLMILIEKPFQILEHRIHIASSIGITFYPQDNADSDTLIRHADQAMYRAKSEGRSTYKIYDPDDDENRDRNKLLLQDFARAVHDEQLRLYYQPKIDLKKGSVLGFEALIRWQHPQQGLLLPADFLPEVEHSPQEILLGEWVVKNALEQLNHWYQQGQYFSLSINISLRQLQHHEFFKFMQQMLDAYPRALRDYFELEILEIAEVKNIAVVARIMNDCKQLGIKFALDDFGTGYSSLNYFHQLPIDTLKIDQNFVKNILVNMDDLKIVEGVLSLSQSIGRPIIAEGVESIEIALMLLYSGCEYAQGFGISKPMPLSALNDWLDFWKLNNNWKQLYLEVQQDDSQFHDLHVAIYSHKLWVQQITRMVLEPNKVIPAVELDHLHCPFSQWYHGIGNARYGTHRAYQDIYHQHQQMHDIAQGIYSLTNDGLREQAAARLTELVALRDSLIHALLSLRNPQHDSRGVSNTE